MNQKLSLPPTPPSVLSQIAALPEQPMETIKALWLDLFGAPPTTHIRTFLERRIAYKLQENALRQVQPSILERNESRIKALMQSESVANEPKTVAAPGTVLIREYQGNEYRVTVRADGQFDFDGRIWGSLSEIARAITGTRWSGPLFFGLRDGKKGKRA